MKGWSLETGYVKNVRDVFPFRATNSGIANSLQLFMILNKRSFNSTCNDWVQGFKVLLHTPGEVAQISNYFIQVPLSQQLYVSVRPNMISTSEALRSYSPKQ